MLNHLRSLRAELASRRHAPDATVDARDDRGSALVMAIVFITVIGLVVTFGLGYSAVSLRASSQHYVPARDRLYASDAAMKAAVQTVMKTPTAGRSQSGGGCIAASTYRADDPATSDDESISVQVCPQGANSLTTSGGGAGWGLQTLATGSEPGVVVAGKGGLAVNGNVNVNSSISVGSNSTLSVNGGVVKAFGGGCTVAKVLVDGVGVANCTVATLPATDPGYVTGLGAAPAAATGSCNSTTKVATLGPGTWTQTTMDTAIGSCNYVWLQPGLHYLQDVAWVIKYKVIAGTLANGTSGMATSALGAGCVKGTNGATLILGGISNILLSSSNPSLEVCGSSIAQPSGDVRLALFGLPADVGTTVTSPFTKSPAAAPTGTTGWTNLSNAVVFNDSAVATSPSFKSTTSPAPALTFSVGLSADPVLPTATTLTAVVRASSSVTTLSQITVDVTDSSASPKTCTTPTKQTVNSNSLKSYTFTITCPSGLKAPFKPKVTATTTSSTNRTVAVDGMTLSYAVTPSTKLAGQSGTYIAPNGAATLSSNGNGKGLWLDGEIYMPKAKIALQDPNSSTALSTMGVVVRVLDMQTTGSTISSPVVAQDNGALNDGDTKVVVTVAGTVWMSCRVTFTASGVTVSKATVSGCTIPR